MEESCPGRVTRGVEVDLQHQGMLDALSVSFDAAIAREEDEAASDLAFSLMHDVRFPDALTRTAHSWQGPDGSLVPVRGVGEDFVLAGANISFYVPFPRLVVAEDLSGTAASPLDLSLLGALRGLCRGAVEVEGGPGRRLFQGQDRPCDRRSSPGPYPPGQPPRHVGGDRVGQGASRGFSGCLLVYWSVSAWSLSM